MLNKVMYSWKNFLLSGVYIFLLMAIGLADFIRMESSSDVNMPEERKWIGIIPEIIVQSAKSSSLIEGEIEHELHRIQDDKRKEATPSSDTTRQKGAYQTMDYGPVIAESIKKEWPENSIVRKGLAIRLDHNTAMIFDTDLVSIAAGTAGGWLDISGTDYMNYRGSEIASVQERQIFGSSEIAGWAKNGSFYGPREDGMGNLPHDWAHYKGYFRYGDRIVLSYTVGGIPVLELPEAIKHDETLVFVRTIRIAASDRHMKTLISESRDSWSFSRVTDNGIIVNTGKTALAFQLANDSNNVSIEKGEAGRIELHLSPSNNPRTVRIFIFEMNSPDSNLYPELKEQMSKTEVPDLQAMTGGGITRWNQEITVSGSLSEKETGYVVDRIPIPFDNPWGSWMRLSGLDFFDDGRAVVTTWNGDVWIVSGLDVSLEQITWRRFASGLFYPMGVAIVDGKIYVTERSQLTRLRDLNGDGEADYYENVNNDGITYPFGLTLGLEVDSDGYFYFLKNGNRIPGEVPQHGALIRISPDGKSREVYARGFRSANSLGIGPDDMILAADQQGEWVPVDRIDRVKQGGFYGYRPHGGEKFQTGEFEIPIAWTPHHVNNSSGLITFAGDPRWGPLAGQWLLGSYGQPGLFTVLIEEIDGSLQGGIVKLPLEFTSGLMRGRVNPADGQLYSVGLRGWGTIASNDASFDRVRYMGGRVHLPVGLDIQPDGVKIVFSDPLDPVSVKKNSGYTIERWEYFYHSTYGSPEISLHNSGTVGRDIVNVSSVKISKDGKELFLKIPDMRSVMQMKISYNLRFSDGQKREGAIYHTVNWLSESDVNEVPEWQQRIISGQLDPVSNTDPEEHQVLPKDSVPEEYAQGAESFQRNCSSCHAGGGNLQMFKAVAPRLDESKLVAESRKAMVRVLLHGKRGSRGVMPSFSWMDDEEIASIISYIRTQWHEREAISEAEVKEIRNMTAERTYPWTDEELRTFY